MPGFNLDDYEPVADRIERFWKDHPDGSIVTELVHHDEKRFIVYVAVWRKNTTVLVAEEMRHDERLSRIFNRPDATGYAEEVIGSTNVNRTSALENCETSAIGRALANLGYAVKNRASREEMEKVQAAPRQRSGMKRTPTPPESPQTPDMASQTNGNGDQAISTVNLKRDLLNRLNGDKPKALMVWRTTLEQFGFGPDDEIPPNLLPIIGDALAAPNWTPA